jgi:ubiquinone/menaquinone biosynthesis C-methylase UbiE
MRQAQRPMLLLGTAAAALAAARHGHGATTGRRMPGGTLIGDAAVYDTLSRLLLGPFFAGVAADVAAAAPHRARVLEAGCGPGHLALRLTRQHGLDVTAVDLDPAMIACARANADRPGDGQGRRPVLLVAEVAALVVPDGSFDLVVSTLLLHQWADPTAGLAELGRVLRPGVGRCCGICGPVHGRIRWSHATRACPTRFTTHAALRFGWSARPHGAGPGGSPSPNGSS